MPCALQTIRWNASLLRVHAAVLLAVTAALSGVGIGCGGSGTRQVTLGPGLSFNTLTIQPSAPQTTTLSNTGKVPVHVTGVVIGGANASDFTEKDTCVGTLAAGASCSITVTFASSTAGTFTGNVTVMDDATVAASPQTVTLTGTAILATPTVSLSTTAQTLPAITAGTSEQLFTATLTNTGPGALSISSIAVTGPGANLFSQTNTCGTMVAAGAACSFTTTFAPRVSGSYTAAISITDNASPVTQSIALTGVATPSTLAIDTTNPTDWKISNGVINLDFNPAKARIFGIFLTGYPDNLVDTTSGNAGIYMDNAGLGAATGVPAFTQTSTYIDWSVTYPSNAANAYTYAVHYVVTPDDPGVHLYFVANHAATDIAGSIGQVQWVYRSNLAQFPNTYSVNADLSNPGPLTVPLPPASESFSTDKGRAVQDATVDLHGLPVPAGYTRSFYTKYDYSSYNYLHQAHGTYGSTYGTWAYFPSNESLVGGPTKQNLIYTGNLLIIEAYSNHLDNALSLSTPAGTASSRLFGPFYIHFNTFGQAYNTTGNTLNTPADMYQDTLQAGASFHTFYDTEQQLLASGYVPSTARGTVSVQVNGVTGAPKTAWAVLSDPMKNIQFTSQGAQYWADISASGSATFSGVIPGTYRLSTYVLGQWGELRQENIVVTANQTTTVPAVTFVPENFGTTTPVFTIGSADRSAHEFLHGHDAAGHDDREFWGAWNYWADFQANAGAVVYNATAGPAGAATNDLSKWNYNHWQSFSPGLFGGVYSTGDDTTDGYKYAIPTYVAGLPGASGTNGVSTRTPPWVVHFATPQNAASSAYAVLSVALASAEASYTVTLNGQPLTWSRGVPSDAAVRSGLSGYTQWIAFQWDTSVLNPAGADNVLTIGVSSTQGDQDDALRLELTNTTADPAVRGWNDYEFLYQTVDTKVNDAVANP